MLYKKIFSWEGRYTGQDNDHASISSVQSSAKSQYHRMGSVVTDQDISTSSSTSSSFFEIYNDENRCVYPSRLVSSAVYNHEAETPNKRQQYIHQNIQSPYTELESLKPNEVIFQRRNDQRQVYFLIYGNLFFCYIIFCFRTHIMDHDYTNTIILPNMTTNPERPNRIRKIR